MFLHSVVGDVMKEETKKELKEFATTGIIVILGLIIIGGSFLWYVGYMMNETKQERHDALLDNLILNNSYEVVNVDSDFVSGNECKFFVSITIKNETNIITLNDFNYDICEDKLYYGWYERNDLKEIYGVIVN